MRNAPALWLGTAGWSLPRAEQHRFPEGSSHLARYAALLPAVEINSTFHRPHRASTYERWVTSVPAGFRFSVKLPRTITHDHRLVGTAALVDAFLGELAPLRERVGCLLVQLPPSLELDRAHARAFFTMLRKRWEEGIAVEPRHASWFTAAGDALLAGLELARVAADPPRAENGLEPGGWKGLAYFRLHGSPRVYYSSYEEPFLEGIAGRLIALRRARIPAWCIFDNTTLGAGTANALWLMQRLEEDRS
jgi:uncharacterized protein YecE (DUF72 family)